MGKFLSVLALLASASLSQAAALPKMFIVPKNTSDSYSEIAAKPDGKGRLYLGFTYSGGVLYDPSGAKCILVVKGAFGQTTWRTPAASPQLAGEIILVEEQP